MLQVSGGCTGVEHSPHYPKVKVSSPAISAGTKNGIENGKEKSKEMLSGLYYKPMTIVNDDSRVEISLNLHLQTTLGSSFTSVTCLLYRPLVSSLPISRPFLVPAHMTGLGPSTLG
jgi:hypothetical protein